MKVLVVFSRSRDRECEGKTGLTIGFGFETGVRYFSASSERRVIRYGTGFYCLNCGGYGY